MNINLDLFDHVKKGNAEAVQTLISKGANVDSRNDEGETPLITAVYEGRKKMVEVLLGNGANVNCKDDFLGRTALWLAIRVGQAEIVSLLKRSGGQEFVFDD